MMPTFKRVATAIPPSPAAVSPRDPYQRVVRPTPLGRAAIGQAASFTRETGAAIRGGTLALLLPTPGGALLPAQTHPRPTRAGKLPPVVPGPAGVPAAGAPRQFRREPGALTGYGSASPRVDARAPPARPWSAHRPPGAQEWRPVGARQRGGRPGAGWKEWTMPGENRAVERWFRPASW